MDFVVMAFLLLPVALFKGALWAWCAIAVCLCAPIVGLLISLIRSAR